MNKTIAITSFIVVFFIVHPLDSLCSEYCLSGALVLAISFSLLNIQIYKFFIGESFYVALPISPTIKPLSECQNDSEKMSRVFHIIFNIFINVIIIVFALKQSWIFN